MLENGFAQIAKQGMIEISMLQLIQKVISSRSKPNCYLTPTERRGYAWGLTTKVRGMNHEAPSLKLSRKAKNLGRVVHMVL